MNTYMAKPVPDGEEFSTVVWWTLILLALFVSCFALWKGVDWLRTRRELRIAAAMSQLETTKEPWDQAIHSRPDGDRNWIASGGVGADLGGLGGMSQREQEILFSTYGPRKVRKEMRQRRRAREQKARERDR